MTIDFPAINIVAVILFCQSVQPPPFPEIYQKFKQWSLNYQFLENQTMQMYGCFEGFPLNSALFGLVI